MRQIKTLVIHHSTDPQDWAHEKTIKTIDKEHKKLHPTKNSIGYHIAYHFLIFKDGTIQGTRPVNEVGYHAGSLPVNLVSIGICLIGNFEKDKPSTEQTNTLRNLLKSLMGQYGLQREDIKLHKEVRLSPTACPGKNITHKYIDSLLEIKPGILSRMIKRIRMLKQREMLKRRKS
jgi:N-acetyl-anhydromuramyl-L-alanine amidase AmpD